MLLQLTMFKTLAKIFGCSLLNDGWPQLILSTKYGTKICWWIGVSMWKSVFCPCVALESLAPFYIELTHPKNYKFKTSLFSFLTWFFLKGNFILKKNLGLTPIAAKDAKDQETKQNPHCLKVQYKLKMRALIPD